MSSISLVVCDWHEEDDGGSAFAHTTTYLPRFEKSIMMKKSIKSAFFLTAFAPAVVVLALKKIYALGPNVEILSWLIAGGIACILPILIAKAITRKSERMPISIKKIESLEWPLLLFIAAYLAPLTTNMESFQVLAVGMVVAAVILSAVDAIPLHPVLHACNYRFYKAEGSNGVVYTLITRRPIRTAEDIKLIRVISPSLIMEE